MSGALAAVDKAGRQDELGYQACKQTREAARKFYAAMRGFGATHDEVMALAKPIFSETAWRLVGPDLAAFRERFEKAEQHG